MTQKHLDIEKNLQEQDIVLPAPAQAAANYLPYIVSGQHVFIAGQLPFLGAQKNFIGILGAEMTIEEGKNAARACGLNILAQLKQACNNDWNRLIRCVKLGGFVRSTPDFTDHPQVINGASDLMAAVLGEKGKHARFAVGVPSLPFGVAVEIDAVFEIKE